MDLRSRNVSESGNAIVSEGWIEHRTAFVDDHPLKEACPYPLGDGAVRLTATLHRVDHRAAVNSLHALQDANFARDTVNGDPKPVRIECGEPRGRIGFARGLKLVAQVRHGVA